VEPKAKETGGTTSETITMNSQWQDEPSHIQGVRVMTMKFYKENAELLLKLSALFGRYELALIEKANESLTDDKYGYQYEQRDARKDIGHYARFSKKKFMELANSSELNEHLQNLMIELNNKQFAKITEYPS
jgi:hypothetical protein